jgi:hypothetical protein
VVTYHFYKQGYEIPFDNFGFAVLRKQLDVPAIIASGVAGYSPLAVGGVRTALPSTGFGIADVLNLFRVPAGFHVISGGFRVTTAGTALATIDLGCVAGSTQLASAANDAGTWLETCLTSAVGNFIFDATLGTTYPPAATTPEDYFITTGSIDMTFNTAAELTLIGDVWVIGCKCF